MRIVFLKDLKGQGKKGDIKEVSDGYANNFLIARGYAKLATQGTVSQIEQQKMSEQRKKDLVREEAEKLASKLKASQVTIKAKAGESGRLFGAITNKQIVEHLETLGIALDKRKLLLDEPIRILGITEVKVKLHSDVIATLMVNIIDEK